MNTFEASEHHNDSTLSADTVIAAMTRDRETAALWGAAIFLIGHVVNREAARNKRARAGLSTADEYLPAIPTRDEFMSLLMPELEPETA